MDNQNVESIQEYIWSILLDIVDRLDDGEDEMDIESDDDSWIPDSDSSGHKRTFDQEFLMDIKERLDQLRYYDYVITKILNCYPISQSEKIFLENLQHIFSI